MWIKTLLPFSFENQINSQYAVTENPGISDKLVINHFLSRRLKRDMNTHHFHFCHTESLLHPLSHLYLLPIICYVYPHTLPPLSHLYLLPIICYVYPHTLPPLSHLYLLPIICYVYPHTLPPLSHLYLLPIICYVYPHTLPPRRCHSIMSR